MDPTTKWTLIAGCVGAAAGTGVSWFAYKHVIGFFRKELYYPPFVCAAGAAAVAFVATTLARDVLAPAPAPTPEQACIAGAQKGQTAVFERKPDGSFSCSYKPAVN